MSLQAEPARPRCVALRKTSLLVLAILTAGLLPSRASGDGARQARNILESTGVRGGLVVHVGCGGGELTTALRAGDGYLVHGLARDAEDVAKAREHIRQKGLVGKLSVARLAGKKLPYADDLVNLVVAEKLGNVPMAEILRVLAPGGVAWIGGRTTVKPRPKTIDEWTHYLHGPDGNPVAHDAQIGHLRRLRWVAGPRWARHHDHMASMTSLVSAGGRLFYIFDEGLTASIQLPSRWHVIARDAFNGTLLWKRRMASWNTRQWALKSGPAHLTRRLVAAGDRVYVTLSLEAPVTALDGATGRTLHTYQGSTRTREILVADGTLLALVGLKPSRLPEFRRRHTYVWDNTRRCNTEWAWQGDKRRITAYHAEGGRQLWSHEAPVAPCSLAADGKRVIFYDGQKVVCLGQKDGKRRWASEAVKAAMPVPTSTGPRTLIHDGVVLFAGNNGRITALDADTGKRLWEGKQHPSGHMSLKDLMVVRGVVWSGAIANGRDSGIFTGRDLKTGKVTAEFKPDVKIYWFHHRCYPAKATDRYLLTSRTGIEFIDPATKHWETHHWVRGGCIYGILPCNGLVYAPMHSCGCYLESKLNGFNALAAGPVARVDETPRAETGRLSRGPAYGKQAGPKPGNAGNEWPTFRHDVGRSGSTPAIVPSSLKQAWSAKPGGRLSAPTIAGGRVFVSAIDAHAIHALDADTGKKLWHYTAGGRVDSPPTIYRGLVLFGAADGYVYALRASDGALAWRYLAAPLDRRHVAFDQVESIWPVHGSVLVHDGVLYCTAGRNIFLDGGIRFLRMDPLTGRKLGEVLWNDRDPGTKKNMQVYVRGLNMPVALSDVLSCDGKHLYMRSQRIEPSGKRVEIPVLSVNEQPADGSHLFCQIGFLDDSWFHRSFWTFGRRVNGGYGGWFQAGRVVPSGRILAFDDKKVYGYGRKPEYYVNASVLEYHLFASKKHVMQEDIARTAQANRRMNRRLGKRNANSSDWKLRRAFPAADLTAARYAWRVDQPSVQVRAMVAAKNVLAVAGHPDVIDERRAFRLPDDGEVRKLLARQAEAIEGARGGRLWLVAKADGKPLGRYELPSPPVFDGLAATEGRLLVCALDGTVRCLAAEGTTPLKPVASDEPAGTISDEPAEPNYLKPPDVDKSGDFTSVRRGRIVQSKLGYRLIAAEKKIVVAAQKLKDPVTRSAVLTTTMRVPRVSGFLVNGFIAFGDAPAEEKLVKCGIRYQPQKAIVAQGGLADKPPTRGADIKAELNKPVKLTVRIDLGAQTVTFTAGEVTVKAKLLKPLKRITHVGFCNDSAVSEFSPLDIQRK